MEKRYINNLDEKTIKELELIMRNDSRYKSRDRAHAILLSNKGKSMEELSEIFGCSYRTIQRWFDRFEADKLDKLHDLEGRGRKPTLKVQKDEKKVKDFLKD